MKVSTEAKGNPGLNLEPQTVKSMVELVDSIELIMTFFNDQAIQDISGTLSQVLKLVNAISSTDLVDILERGLMDPELDKALLDPPTPGLWGLMSALGDEDMKRGVGIVVELVKAIGRASREFGEQ
jgi:uncharacterized protein YjgD (DUF1641 family)